MGRSPCCLKEGMNRGAWTAMEDKTLTDYIKLHGEGKWRTLPKNAGLMRCGKSCRLRWLNYLRPDIKRGNITHDEEQLIIRLHKLLGNRWSLIAGRLPGRTDNEIKNYWNTKIGKKHSHNEQSPISSHSKLEPSSEKDKPISPSSGQNRKLVWTKASRCNKVVLPYEQLADLHQVIKPEAALPDTAATNLGPDNAPFQEPLPQFKPGDDDFPDLTVDFEMDEHLLSHLLNTNFSDVMQHVDDSNTSNLQGRNIFSPKSSQLADDDALFLDDTPSNATYLPLVANCEMDQFDGFSWLHGSI